MSNNLMKSFSVIVPCYNSEKYVRTALQSIVDSKYLLDKIEVLVVDDGSTNSQDLYKTIESFLVNYPNVFKFFHKKNGNWGSVINYVKKNNFAKNDLICILDSDDKYKPCFFDVVNKKIKDNDVFITSFTVVEKKIRYKAQPYYFLNRQVKDRQKYTVLVYPGCVIYKKEIFYSLEDLDENLTHQDTVLFFDALRKTNKIRWTSKNTSVYWRSRQGNTMTSNFDDKKIKSQLNVFYRLKKWDIENQFFWFLLQKNFCKELEKRNIVLDLHHKIKFTWAPIWMKWIFHILLWKKIKKIFIYKKENRE